MVGVVKEVIGRAEQSKSHRFSSSRYRVRSLFPKTIHLYRTVASRIRIVFLSSFSGLCFALARLSPPPLAPPLVRSPPPQHAPPSGITSTSTITITRYPTAIMMPFIAQ